MNHARTLIVGQLDIQSSYLRNEELPATTERFDTVQWWIGPTVAWRIRTFAIDLDIHLHRLEPSEELIDRALASTNANYSDVLQFLVRIDLTDYTNENQVAAELSSALGAPGLELAPDLDMGFWNPGASHYSTQSSPE